MSGCYLQTKTEFYVFCSLLDNTVRFRWLTPEPTVAVPTHGTISLDYMKLNTPWAQRLCCAVKLVRSSLWDSVIQWLTRSQQKRWNDNAALFVKHLFGVTRTSWLPDYSNQIDEETSFWIWIYCYWYSFYRGINRRYIRAIEF